MLINNKQILADFFNALKNDVIKEQKQQGRVASGKSIEEYEVQADSNQASLLGVSYVGTLETGRKPGKVPSGFTQIILKWIEDKSLFSGESEQKKKSIAFLIARSISLNGTKLFQQGGNSGIISNIITDQRLASFTDLLMTSFQNAAVNQILTQFKSAA